MRRLADLQGSDDEDEGDGTAKLKESTQALTTPSTSTRFTAPSDWRNSIAQNRLSNLFDSWIHPSSSNSTADLPAEKKTVSEPRLIKHQTGGSIVGESIDSGENIDEDGRVDAQEFEDMLVSCAINIQFTHFSDSFLRTLSA